MSFRTRLVSGHIFLLLLIAGTGATAVVALHLTTSDSERIAHMMSEELVAVERMRFQAEQVVATSRGYLLTGNPSSLERFDTETLELQRSIRELRGRLDPTGAALAAAVGHSGHAYVATAIEAARRRALQPDSSALLPYFEDNLKPRRADFEARTNALLDYVHARTDGALARSQAFARTAELVLVLASLAVLGIGIALAVATIKRLSLHYSRMQTAERAARAAATARAEILAVVSHDLRNPLGSISLASSLLEETTNPSGQAHVRIIHKAADRMLHLVDQLLEAESLDTDRFVLSFERCCVKTLFDDVLELFRPRAAKLGIELQGDSTDEWITCDRERALEVLSNLVGNALDHTPRGGAITLHAERTARDVRFVVTDTGSGIPPDQLPHVFERNWRAPRQGRKSFGLGLYICKRLVDAHAGTIGVRSAPGAGSSFWFTIPLSQPT